MGNAWPGETTKSFKTVNDVYGVLSGPIDHASVRVSCQCEGNHVKWRRSFVTVPHTSCLTIHTMPLLYVGHYARSTRALFFISTAPDGSMSVANTDSASAVYYTKHPSVSWFMQAVLRQWCSPLNGCAVFHVDTCISHYWRDVNWIKNTSFNTENAQLYRCPRMQISLKYKTVVKVIDTLFEFGIQEQIFPMHPNSCNETW